MDTPYPENYSRYLSLLENADFQVINDKCCLSGMYELPVEVWDLIQQRLRASENVVLALKNNQGDQNIFLGIEHLEYLLPVSSLFQKPLVIIEKCRFMSETFCRDRQSVPENIKIVVGNWGLVPSIISGELYRQIFYYSEIIPLVLQLMELRDVSFQKINLLTLASNELDCDLVSLIKQCLHFLGRRDAWHKKNAPLLSALKTVPVKQEYLILANEEESADSLQTLAGNVVRQASVLVLAGSANEDKIRFLPNNHYEQETFFEDVFLNADRFLSEVSKSKPLGVITRNFQANYRPEFAFLFADIVRSLNMGINILSPDWHTMLSTNFMGGWSVGFYKEIFKGVPIHIFNLFPYQASLYLKPGESVSYLPFHFSKQTPKPRQPLPPGELQRDIAIVHKTRAYSIDTVLFRKFYEFLSGVKGNTDLGIFLNGILYQLRHEFIDPMNYGKRRSELIANYIEWYFYNLIKLDRIKEIVHHCTDFKVHLFGDYSYLFPPEICRDGQYGLDEMQDIYQTSLVTLDVKPMYSLENLATVNSVQCYASGGLPLIAGIKHRLRSGVSYDFSVPENFLTFSNTDDLKKIMVLLKNEPQLRQNLIKKAQSTWLADLGKGKYFTPLEELKTVLVNKVDALEVFDFGVGKNDFIGNMILGILLVMSGFIMKAAELWDQSMRHYDQYPSSICFLIHKYLNSLQQTERADWFLHKSLEQNPMDADLLGQLNK